ncbi:hypothetical protein ACLKA6_006923 [Drosophila palustris]
MEIGEGKNKGGEKCRQVKLEDSLTSRRHKKDNRTTRTRAQHQHNNDSNNNNNWMQPLTSGRDVANVTIHTISSSRNNQLVKREEEERQEEQEQGRPIKKLTKC